MSFDVFFQRFRSGGGDTGGSEQMRQALQPYIARDDSDQPFAHVSYGDGEADVYLGDGHGMVNHVSGEKPWELLVRGARAADWVILPVGCPTCITDETQRGHLPDGLNEDVVLVGSGEELLRVMRPS